MSTKKKKLGEIDGKAWFKKTELRNVTVYECDGREYTKSNALEVCDLKILDQCDSAFRKICKDHGYKSATVLRATTSTDWMKIYEIMTSHVAVRKQLELTVDTDE